MSLIMWKDLEQCLGHDLQSMDITYITKVYP